MTEKCIVIEALSALQGGGQTYLKNLFEHFVPVPGERIVAIVPRQYRAALAVNPAIEYLAPHLPARGVVSRILWNIFVLPGLLRKLNAGVMYCPGGFLATRPKNCKTVVAFRNMLPFAIEERRRYPMGYMRFRLWLLRHIQGSSFRDADLVIFISKFAKSVIDLSVGDRKGTSVVIPHGLSEQFRKVAPTPVNPAFLGEYVLYVSIMSVYKAQLEVVQAWAMLRKVRPTKEKLVLIGPNNGEYALAVSRLVEELQLQGEVILMGNVPYTELPGYYQHAKVNLFASSCENCPNILLECLAAGRPVLCSDFQPMPEFGRDAVQYFDPYNPDQLANKLATTLDSEPSLADWAARASRRGDDFQWSLSAGQTWSALRQLAAGTD